MVLARRRLALVAFLLLTLGGSATVAVTAHQVTSDGHLPSVARVFGPDALANGIAIGTAPKGATRGDSTSGSKRQARSFLLAATGAVLGLVVLGRRHRRRDASTLAPVVDQRSRPTRAPPGLATTLS
ncbi:MAG: hypothetical protein JWN67_2596 [Actinomycetia bacterium]|nr:hypothetical protein [Actinomycetes bacterium]